MTDFPTIPRWSFSALSVFETCPYWAYLRYIQRHKEPTPDPNSPVVRGQNIHNEAEFYVTNGGDLPLSLRKFKEKFQALRELYLENCVELEQEWGIDKNWNTVSWQDPLLWGRIKLDAFVRLFKKARVIDYKTGKSWGNEVKHGQQGLTYAVTAFMRHPDLEEIDIEFWYLDEGDKKKPKTITREMAIRHLPKIHNRADIMTSTTDFKPKPNQHNCRWCPYRPGKLDVCPYGVNTDDK